MTIEEGDLSAPAISLEQAVFRVNRCFELAEAGIAQQDWLMVRQALEEYKSRAELAEIAQVKASMITPESRNSEEKFTVGGQWYYRGNCSSAWFATHREGGGLAERLQPELWPLLEEIARLRLLAASEKAHLDSARLDYLAEITNLSALEVAGRKLTGEENRRLMKAEKALSSGYEVHRRTQDTPAAFRAAVDDARRERGSEVK